MRRAMRRLLLSVAETSVTELRGVDTDPSNWASITFNVFEHLIEKDQHGR